MPTLALYGLWLLQFFFCLPSYRALKLKLLFLNSDYDGVFRHCLTTYEISKPECGLQETVE